MIRLADESLNHTLCCERIADEILERTSGRIRSLRVELAQGRVVISGEVGTYYVGQLALSAAQGLLRNSRASLEWRLQVSARPELLPHSPGGNASARSQKTR